MQTSAAVITALVVFLIFSCFYFVLSHTQGAVALESVAPKAYRIRTLGFLLVVVAGVIISVKTLTPWPHEATAGVATKTVSVKASQWRWELPEMNVKVGDSVEFVVTSADVNHGFGLYAPSGQLVTQIQAMPGFENKVTYRFAAAGKYKVLCMEYCGLAHHRMDAEIDVAPANVN